jgi:hypothetical protein
MASSIWTQADLTAVKAGVMALAGGARVVTVTYAGPPERSVTYGQAGLETLRALLSEIARAVNGAPQFRRASFNKGFDPPSGDQTA